MHRVRSDVNICQVLSFIPHPKMIAASSLYDINLMNKLALTTINSCHGGACWAACHCNLLRAGPPRGTFPLVHQDQPLPFIPSGPHSYNTESFLTKQRPTSWTPILLGPAAWATYQLFAYIPDIQETGLVTAFFFFFYNFSFTPGVTNPIAPWSFLKASKYGLRQRILIIPAKGIWDY